MNKKIYFCIPARYESKRLSKKLLLPIGDKSCIQKTISQLYSSKYFNDNIIVFTDSNIIKTNLVDYKCSVIITDGKYRNGTERIAKNLDKIADCEIIVNIQADEPFISAKNIDYCIDQHLNSTDPLVFYTTLHESDNSNDYLQSTASLKLVTDNDNNVIYYSRNVIPYNKLGKINDSIYYKTFTGIYVYDRQKIDEYGTLKNSFLQNEEDCEQLKLLENGYRIKTYSTIEYNEISLNTQDDYDYLLYKYCKPVKNIILDCTIRDGGYINNWRFSSVFIQKYRNLMEEINIDYVEIGFANKTKKYKGCIVGVSRHITDEYLLLFSDAKFKLSVMADYKDIDMDFLQKDSSIKNIDLVRIAFHKRDMKEAIDICIELQTLGYKVSVNAMAITNYSSLELSILIDLVNRNGLNILYIADSYGSLNSIDLTNYIEKLQCNLKCTSIGIHLHNNMNNAFTNFIYTKNISINTEFYIDCTLFGMGRGAGNLQTELVLVDQKVSTDKIIKVLQFINDYIHTYYNTGNTNWGYSLDYFISGFFKFHPNYIDKFRELNLTFKNKILLIEKIISDDEKDYFNKEYIDNLIAKFNTKLVEN